MKRHETAKWHVTSPPGHVTFRLLFPADAAAAIIGPNGANQKKLLRETGAFKIRVDDSLPGCSERVVNVGGDAKVDRTMTICDEGGGRRVVEVSAAQAAVVRVYELVAAEMSVVRSNECVKNCRLLVVSGVEVWKSDDELKIIEKDCGAFVRLLSPELLPLCADVSDELIEITGASLAVKKALIAVTRCIQGAWSKSSVSCASTSSAPSRNLPAQKDQCHKIESNDNDPSCVLDADTKEVTFKLICPAHASGGLVGWEKTVIKNLEIETGASIMVLPPLVGCDEIVITVSAMESKEWQCSPAQNAAACVFIRSTENGARSKHTSSGNNEVRVKPIVPCDQADGVDLTSNMENTEVQILDAHPTRLAFADEKIIQGHQFSRGTNFQCFASTGDGSIVVGSIDGKIRLYSKTSMRQAKTVFPSLGSPITHVDVTYDGKWVLATTDTYLLLICTLFTDKGGRTKTGFSDRMGNRASAPGMLKLMPLHAHMAGSNSKFRGGQFSWVTEEGNQERHIVVTVGKFSVIWNFEQVKDSTHKCYQNQRGLKRCYCYKIVLKDESIVDSRFMHDKFADCRSPEAPLVVATPMKVTFFSISAKQ